MTDVLDGVETFGQVVQWSPTNSYGWVRRIKAKPGTSDVFIHERDCWDGKRIAAGQYVKFLLRQTPKGPRGLGVEILR